jgi:hypothetical protein
MRHTGAGSTATYFMVKAQDNTTPYTGWDRFFVYWYNGASYNVIAAFGDIVPPTPLARIRLQVLDEGPTTRVQAFLDTDGDGLWNFTRDATTPLGLGVTGKIGINNYQSAKADDLKHFNAALYLAGTPTVGMPVNLNGRATSGYGYLGACSLGHAGIPLADGRIVPLDLDALMLLSLTTPAIFTNFSGTVDATGNFVMTLNTPPVPQLAGFTIWSSAVTFTPNGIQEIAPDVQITFVP